MAKNPDPMPMRDATNNDSAHNHGIVDEPMSRGTFVRAYGLDRSTQAGTAQDERMTHRGFGGGTKNIAHSLGGATVNQTGRSKR